MYVHISKRSFSKKEVGVKFGRRQGSWSVLRINFFTRTSTQMAGFGNITLKICCKFVYIIC